MEKGKKAKKDYYNKLIFQNCSPLESKNLWRIIKANLNKNNKGSDIPGLIVNSVEFTSDVEKADCFNTYFTSNNVIECSSKKPEDCEYFGPRPIQQIDSINLPCIHLLALPSSQ